MFNIPKTYEESKKELHAILNNLKQDYDISTKRVEMYENLYLDKVVIKSQNKTKKRFVISSGLHGIEGYMGHAVIAYFLQNLLSLLDNSTEVVIYHTINPYGMKYLKRTNENNVDLNRNFNANNPLPKPTHNLSRRYIKAVRPASLKKYTERYDSINKLILEKDPKTRKTIYGEIGSQSTYPDGMFYTGVSFQRNTKYMMSEIDRLHHDDIDVIWFDVHTGLPDQRNLYIIHEVNDKDESLYLKKKLDYVQYIPVEDINVRGTLSNYLVNVKPSSCKVFYIALEYGTCKKEYDTSIIWNLENARKTKRVTNKLDNYISKMFPKTFIRKDRIWLEEAEDNFIKVFKDIQLYKNI